MMCSQPCHVASKIARKAEPRVHSLRRSSKRRGNKPLTQPFMTIFDVLSSVPLPNNTITKRRGVKMVHPHSTHRQPTYHTITATPQVGQRKLKHFYMTKLRYIQLSHQPKAELQHSRKLCFIQIASNTPQLAFTMNYDKFTGQMGVPAGATSLHRPQPTTVHVFFS